MRRYNFWAGNPNGTKEDLTRCIAEVWDGRGLFYQCSNNRGKGPDSLYCGTHAARIAKGKSVDVGRVTER